MVAKESPTEDEIKNRGELDEDAEVGGVIGLKGFVVGDPREGV